MAFTFFLFECNLVHTQPTYPSCNETRWKRFFFFSVAQFCPKLLLDNDSYHSNMTRKEKKIKG